MIGALLPDIWPYIAGLGALLFGAWRLWRGGKKAAKGEMAVETLKRGEAGRKSAAAAKADLAKGKTPEEIVRENDGKW